MNALQLTDLVCLILALSVASERLVEIVKGWVPFLSHGHADPAIEGRRKSILQLLAVVAGVCTALLSAGYLPPGIGVSTAGWEIIVLGLLASGGSGFWHAVLTYMAGLKDLQSPEGDGRR
jgi:hypothetical protein